MKKVVINEILRNVNDLINEKKYNEALKILNSKELENSSIIQSLKIKLLIEKSRMDEENKIKRLNTALKLAEDERFQNNNNILIQKIEILIKLAKMSDNKIEQMLELYKYVSNIKKKDNFKLEILRIKILLLLVKYDKKNELEYLNMANDIIKNSKYKNKSQILQLKNKILTRLNNICRKNNDTNKIKNNYFKEQNIIRLIDDGKLSLLDIQALDINRDKKKLLSYIYYEKNDYPYLFRKKYLQEWLKVTNNKNTLLIIKRLLANLRKNKRCFDICFYNSLISDIKILKRTK